jgi:hypothetical protein
MSHQRQMEWRQKRPPEEWRGYQRLGVAVIASAVQDLKKPTRAGKESGWARESARAFLTGPEPQPEVLVQRGGFRHEHDPAEVLA